MKLLRLIVNILALVFMSEAVVAALPTHSPSKDFNDTHEQSRSNASSLNESRAEKPMQLGRSVLDDAPPASPKLTSLIRGREGSSEAGLSGVTLLMDLLREKGLSINDRSWIQSRLNESKAIGDFKNSLLPPTFPPILFVHTGLKQHFQVGENITIKVDAAVNGKTIPLRCSLPDAQVTTVGKTIQIKWTAISPTVRLLTCTANGHADRKLIKVLNSQRSR